MSKDLNLCQFIGRMGNDPDIRVTQSGITTASFDLACGDDYKDKTTGQKVEQTNWIRCVAFGRLAEIIKDYTHKGSKVYVSGKQSTRKWQDQNGQDRYTTEIVANELQMLDSNPAGQQQGYQDQQGYQQPQQGYQQQAQYAQQPQGQQQRPQQRQQPQQQRQPQTQPSTMAQNPRNYAQNQAKTYHQSHPGVPQGMPQDDFDQDIPF